MQSTILKFFGGGKFFLALATVVFVLTACKGAGADTTTDEGTTNNPPPVTPTTYTITVDPKGGTGVEKSYSVDAGQNKVIPDPTPPSASVVFGGWTYTDGSHNVDFESGVTVPTQNIKIFAIWLTLHTVTINSNTGTSSTITTIPNIKDGAPLPLAKLVNPPTRTDYEIAYWSKTKDDFNDPFEFDQTPVTGNITIYPHWRYTLAKVRSLLNGDWNVLPLLKVFRVRESGSNTSACEATDYTLAIPLSYDIGSRNDLINAIRAITLTVPYLETSTVGDITVTCRPNLSQNNLNYYIADNNNDIDINGFVYFSINTKNTTSIILSSTDDYQTNFRIKVTGGEDEGTYTATRIP